MLSIAAVRGVGRRTALAVVGTLSGASAAFAYKLDQSVKAELTLHPPRLRWSHSGLLDSLDHASIRRGYQVP